MPRSLDEGSCYEYVFLDVDFLAGLDDADLGCILYLFGVSLAWNFTEAGHYYLWTSKSRGFGKSLLKCVRCQIPFYNVLETNLSLLE